MKQIVTIKICFTGIEMQVPVELLPQLPAYCVKLSRRHAYGCSIRYLPEILAQYRNIHTLEEIPTQHTMIRRLYDREMHRRNESDEIKHQQLAAGNNLWEHQLRGTLLAKVNSRYAFFYDTRTGKTRMAYQIICDAINEGRIHNAIVFVPSSIIPDWLSDAKFFPDLRVAAFYKDTKTKTAALAAEPDVLLMSIEQTVNNADMLYSHKFDMAFVDESSKLKSHKSQISKFMRDYSLTVEYFYLLSATPAPNGLHEYYTQMMCLDPYIFPQARTHFVNKYFINTSRNVNFEKLSIKPELKDEFMSRIEEYAIYVDQSVMPMAGKEFSVIEYKLPNEAMAIYDDMRSNMSIELGDKELTVDMAAAMRSKLQQITSGFIIDTEARKQNAAARFIGEAATQQDTYSIQSARAARLKTLLTILQMHTTNEQYVIWANYQQEFIDIRDALSHIWLPSEIAVINGTTPLVDKEDAVRDFKAGKVRVLICHPASVGMGKNFTESHIAIYYSLTDSWELFKQSSERIAGHINVQPKKCLYYIIQAKGTINELVYDNIIHKRSQSYGMLEHLKSKGDHSYA